MASNQKDNSLVSAPRSSGFGLLLSSDSETETVGTNLAENKATESTLQEETSLESSKQDEASVEIPIKSSLAGPDEWSSVNRKMHKKSTRSNSSSFSSTSTQHHRRKNSQVLRKHPVSIDQFSAENSFEIFDFPVTWRSHNLRRMLEAFDGHYRLKWQNDNSCLVLVEELSFVERALAGEISDECAKVRAFDPANVVKGVPKPDIPLVCKEETTLEFSDFSPTLGADGIHKIFSSFAGHYRLKWNHEKSCWIIFDSIENCQKALSNLESSKGYSIRQYKLSPNAITAPQQ